MRFYIVAIFVGFIGTSVAVPVLTDNFQRTPDVSIAEPREVSVRHEGNVERAAMGFGYSKRGVNFKEIQGAKVPELGEIFEGHKTSSEHEAM